MGSPPASPPAHPSGLILPSTHLQSRHLLQQVKGQCDHISQNRYLSRKNNRIRLRLCLRKLPLSILLTGMHLQCPRNSPPQLPGNMNLMPMLPAAACLLFHYWYPIRPRSRRLPHPHPGERRAACLASTRSILPLLPRHLRRKPDLRTVNRSPCDLMRPGLRSFRLCSHIYSLNHPLTRSTLFLISIQESAEK